MLTLLVSYFFLFFTTCIWVEYSLRNNLSQVATKRLKIPEATSTSAGQINLDGTMCAGHIPKELFASKQILTKQEDPVTEADTSEERDFFVEVQTNQMSSFAKQEVPNSIKGLLEDSGSSRHLIDVSARPFESIVKRDLDFTGGRHLEGTIVKRDMDILGGQHLGESEQRLGNHEGLRYLEDIAERHNYPLGSRHVDGIEGKHFFNIGGETHSVDIAGRQLADVRNIEESERAQFVYSQLPLGVFSTVEGYKGHVV